MSPMIIAHRGFSGRQPEMTRAAYAEAIAWSARTGVPLGLECDVHFSADDQLICLHDLTVDRTSNGRGTAYAMTVAELKLLNFAAGRVRLPRRAQRELLTLGELLDLVAEGRAAGAPVSCVIETKHPNPRGGAVERRVAEMLIERGWHRAGSPVQVISFDEEAVARLGELLPEIERTLLIEVDFGRWRDGSLPDGVSVAGPDLALIRTDPAYVGRALDRGHQVRVWTVNRPADFAFCLGLGVTGFTTDWPDRAARYSG